jgi:hypothetical protein
VFRIDSTSERADNRAVLALAWRNFKEDIQ